MLNLPLPYLPGGKAEPRWWLFKALAGAGPFSSLALIGGPIPGSPSSASIHFSFMPTYPEATSHFADPLPQPHAIFTICLSYGGQQEIRSPVQSPSALQEMGITDLSILEGLGKLEVGVLPGSVTLPRVL